MRSPFDPQILERTIVQELYREYRSILHIRKLRLRPAAIALFDSETHWGRWDPQSRTLSLSRKLIFTHPWFQVLGILRHEMAHQWVDEASGRTQRGLPHGEDFRAACKVVGVPEEFCRASAELDRSSLDWREEVRDEASERLLDKVRKLLALATSSNEHEALLAMNKVREVYAKYNLEQAASDTQARFVHLVINNGKKRTPAHESKIVGILVGHFFVQILLFKQFDAHSGEKHRAFELIGTRENVLMAEYVYRFLMQQTDFWVREAKKASPTGMSRLAAKSYRLGLLGGFAEKLRQSEMAQGPGGAAADREPAIRSSGRATELSLTGKALALFHEDKQLDQYMREIYPRLSKGSTAWQTIDDSAFDAGHAVGKTLTLNKAVETRSESSGRFLG